MASPGAESLIGWHVNRDWDEAARFYSGRPLPRAVQPARHRQAGARNPRRGQGHRGRPTGAPSIKRAEEDVRKIAPPIVVIQSPGDGSTFRTPEVTIEYNVVLATGQSITKVEYFDQRRGPGRPLLRAGRSRARSRSHKLTLPAAARGRHRLPGGLRGRQGERAGLPIRLRWDGPKPGRRTCRACARCSSASNKYAKLQRARDSPTRTPPTSRRSSRRTRARATARSRRRC